MLKIKNDVDLKELEKFGFEDDIRGNNSGKITFEEEEGYEGMCEIAKILEYKNKEVVKYISFHNFNFSNYLDTKNIFMLKINKNNKWTKRKCPKKYLLDLIQAGLVEEVDK